MSDFGAQILTERRRRRIRQSDLAIELGVSIHVMVAIERDQMPVSATTLEWARKAMYQIQSRRGDKVEAEV
jgi:transcriptional regulator with XRE-family HTH domain